MIAAAVIALLYGLVRLITARLHHGIEDGVMNGGGGHGITGDSSCD
jgi:hypothetical protein